MNALFLWVVVGLVVGVLMHWLLMRVIIKAIKGGAPGDAHSNNADQASPRRDDQRS